MRVIGIDPGYAIVGFGVVDYARCKFSVVGYGSITTDAGTPFHLRLLTVYEDLCAVLDKYKPDHMAVEKLFFNTNEKTAINVAQARGVTVLPAVQRGILLREYTPLQVKTNITGYGRAEKQQVQEMTKLLLHLKEIPKPDDVADALALAITHARLFTTLTQLEEQCGR
ncbi:MAG: crossover junction endodeoxyribonuclease RuvC [Oscillospiraceae bacterium]